MKATVTYVGIAIFVVFSVLVSSSWAAKFTNGLVVRLPFDEGAGKTTKDASGNRHNGTLERRLKWEIKTSNGLKIPEGWEPFAYDCNDEQDPFLLRRRTTGK